MSSNENYTALFFIVLGIIIFSNNNKVENAYQVSPYGKDKAIVLNTVTGEAWATKESTAPYSGLTTVLLEPIEYWIQDRDFMYKANESRNSKNKNSDWLSDCWEKIKNSFSENDYKKKQA